MDFSSLSKTQISLAGEFGVLSQFYLRGYEANLTLGNAEGIDRKIDQLVYKLYNPIPEEGQTVEGRTDASI